MKTNLYLFRISFLELHYPIVINENIILLPNEENKRNEIEINSIFVDFNPHTYSYILFQYETPQEKDELEKTAKIILSIFSILLLNPLYLFEYFHFTFQENEFLLQEATLEPFTSYYLDKQRNYLHVRLGVHTLNEIFNDLFQKLRGNPISDSIYSIIMEYILVHRERIIDISGPIAWNVLEHLASRYWNRENKDKLYIIRKETFEAYIETLSRCADEFIKRIKEKEVLIDHPSYKGNYKGLLKISLTPEILKFSPVKFRIFKMFENEKIEYESKKELIKDMYDIRNKIYHDGLNLEEIKNKLGKDSIDVMVKFKPFLYRKILELLGFIDEFFFFDSGHLAAKEFPKEIPNILKWEPNIPTKIDELKLIQEIKPLEDLLVNLIGTDFDVEVLDKKENYKTKATFSKKNEDYIITFLNPPMIFFKAFNEITSEDQKYPEDIIRYLRTIKCTFINNPFRYELEFYNRSIYSTFDLKISHPGIEKYIEEQTGKKRKVKEEISKIPFKINKISIKKSIL